jgi:hypothetical protein
MMTCSKHHETINQRKCGKTRTKVNGIVHFGEDPWLMNPKYPRLIQEGFQMC